MLLSFDRNKTDIDDQILEKYGYEYINEYIYLKIGKVIQIDADQKLREKYLKLAEIGLVTKGEDIKTKNRKI